MGLVSSRSDGVRGQAPWLRICSLDSLLRRTVVSPFRFPQACHSQSGRLDGPRGEDGLVRMGLGAPFVLPEVFMGKRWSMAATAGGGLSSALRSSASWRKGKPSASHGCAGPAMTNNSESCPPCMKENPGRLGNVCRGFQVRAYEKRISTSWSPGIGPMRRRGSRSDPGCSPVPKRSGCGHRSAS